MRTAPASARDPDNHQLLTVLTALKKGDFTVRMPVDYTGIPGKIADALNDVIEQQAQLTKEVRRISSVVGKEGKTSQRASFDGVKGSWGDCIDAVNNLIVDLVQPTTEVARVIGAVANGDLSQTMALDIDGRRLTGEFLRTAKTINTMVGQLNGFASEVTRVAREVGTEGKLGGQADVKGVAGTWKDLTDSVNFMASNLTSQVRNIAEVTTAVATGDLSKKITADAKGEILELKNTVNAGRGRHLARSDRQRQSARRQPHHPGARHRRGRDRGHHRRSVPVDQRRGGRGGRGLEGQHQPDDPQPRGHDAYQHRARLAQDQCRALHPSAPGGAGSAHRLAPDPLRARALGLDTAWPLLFLGGPQGRR